MAGVNQIFNLADDVAKYVKSCGRSCVLQTKPINPNQLKGLHLSPKVIGDTINISKRQGVENLITLTKNEAIEILEKSKNIKSFNASNQTVNLEIQGIKTQGQFIGGGMSKSAYRTVINNEDVCVLLPSSGWKDALNEAENVRKLKELGLVTNDYCKIVKVKANGVDIPALITKPYDKHIFKIFDAKNPNNFLDDYIEISNVSEKDLPIIFSDLIKDINLLSKKHIVLGSDCINLAFKDGKLRLFLSDLPYDNLIDLSFSSKKLQEGYLVYALDAFQALFSYKTYNSSPILQAMGDYIGNKKIIESLLTL